MGMGPGNPDLLTMRAAEVLRSADCIFYVEGENSRTSISRLIATALGKDVEKKLRKLSFSMAPVMSDRQKAWKMEYADRYCVQESDSLVFMKTYKTRASVVDMIRKNRREDFLYASRVGLEDELIISDSGNVADIPEEYLSLIISRKSQFLIDDIE